MDAVEMVVGAVVWVGLAVLALGWLARTLSGGRGAPPAGPGAAHPRSTPAPAGPGPTTPPRDPVELDDQRWREEEAFVDGAVIGYHLAREHHRRRPEAAAADLDADPVTWDGDDVASVDEVGDLDDLDDLVLDELEAEAEHAGGMDDVDGFDDLDGFDDDDA